MSCIYTHTQYSFSFAFILENDSHYYLAFMRVSKGLPLLRLRHSMCMRACARYVLHRGCTSYHVQRHTQGYVLGFLLGRQSGFIPYITYQRCSDCAARLQGLTVIVKRAYNRNMLGHRAQREGSLKMCSVCMRQRYLCVSRDTAQDKQRINPQLLTVATQGLTKATNTLYN